MFGQTIVKADGFGTMLRWSVESARQVTVGGQTFWNLTIRPEAMVDANGSDIPDVVLSRGRVVSSKVTGPVETHNIY